MKHQYFGDVNDYHKYGLLRLLIGTIPAGADRLRLGVCWMLTAQDGSKDGKFLSYFNKPQKYRHRDPELFDWLHQVVTVEKDRRTTRIEVSSLLGPAIFQSKVLADDLSCRSAYFADSTTSFAGCDLVFFDPDNGLEVKSTARGRKDSCKYLFWEEAAGTFSGGSSLLIYQHFIREDRQSFTNRLAGELRARLGAPAVFSFTTPRVLFLLAAQGRHAGIFRDRLPAIRSRWAPEIVAEEHVAANQELMQQTRD